MTQQPRYIRIIAIPAGEAPLWVREKWVGLELPLADGKNAAQQVFTSGVLSGPRNRFLAIIWGLLGRLKVQSGYPVYVNEALGVLEQTAPDAAHGGVRMSDDYSSQNVSFYLRVQFVR